MKCPKCHTENPDTKKFCRECGAKILSLCPGCGVEVSLEDKFCGEYGHNLPVPSEPTRSDLPEPRRRAADESGGVDSRSDSRGRKKWYIS